MEGVDGVPRGLMSFGLGAEGRAAGAREGGAFLGVLGTGHRCRGEQGEIDWGRGVVDGRNRTAAERARQKS